MIAAHKKNHVKRISGPTKLNIALHAIRRQHTVTEISRPFNCSRTTVYKQQDKALDAANKVFEQDDEEVLFYIPVTKSFIHQSVVALRLICESSYRNIQFYIQALYKYRVPLGAVFNILNNTAEKAIPINESYDLSLIKDSVSDELFHWVSSILATRSRVDKGAVLSLCCDACCSGGVLRFELCEKKPILLIGTFFIRCKPISKLA